MSQGIPPESEPLLGKWGKKIGSWSISCLIWALTQSWFQLHDAFETLVRIQSLLPFQLLWNITACCKKSCSLDTDVLDRPTQIPPGAQARAGHNGCTHFTLTRQARKASGSLNPQYLHLILIKNKVSNQIPNMLLPGEL